MVNIANVNYDIFYKMLIFTACDFNAIEKNGGCNCECKTGFAGPGTVWFKFLCCIL